MTAVISIIIIINDMAIDITQNNQQKVFKLNPFS